MRTKVRGVISLHYGDIPKSTWSSTFNDILEAHAGVRLLQLGYGLMRVFSGPILAQKA